MTFSVETATGGALLFAWICACLRTHRGPLVVLALAVTHLRASLLCARREAGRVPERWRREYQFSLRDVKEQG